MTIEQAIAAIRGWRLRPESVTALLAEYEKLQREMQESRRKP